MQKNEASKFLDYYLDQKTETEFAVMLDGPWGSGKTHFIKKYLKDRALRLGTFDKTTYLYASLYGISSTSDITDQFFAQSHPILNSKASRIFGAIASRALNGFAGTDVNSSRENNSIIQDMILKLDGKILILDDLERSSMNIADVLGFINTYVEHENLKVIILANENDIHQDHLPTYLRQKEKLIGKTIQVQSDPIEVIDKLIDRIEITSVKSTLTREKAEILATFLASGKPNFRNLRAIIFEYERLINSLDCRLQASPEAMKQLLLYMIATGNEYRSGDLDHQTLATLPTTHYFSLGLPGGASKTSAQLTFEKFKSRYTDVKWIDPIISPANLSELYRSGLIDVDNINNALSQHPAIVGNTETPPWRLLWSWTDLPRTDYLKARNKLAVQLSKHEITHPGIILHAAGSILLLEKFEDKLLGENIDVVKFFENYLNTLLKNGLLIPDRKTFGYLSGAYASLTYASNDTEEFRKIHKLVKSATDIACAKEMESISASFIKRLASDSDSYIALYEYGFDNGNYADVAFLHNLDIAEFSRILIIDSSPNDRLFASLTRRYENERHHSFRLKEEYDWLTKLKIKLTDIINHNKAPYKNLLTMRTNYYFDLIEDSINMQT